MLPIPIPLPASFSTMSNDPTISRQNILANNSLSSSFGRGRRGNNNNTQNGHNQRNSNIGNVGQDIYENMQQYQSSSVLHHSQPNVDWIANRNLNLPKPSQNSSPEPSGSNRMTTERRKSSDAMNMDISHHNQPKLQPNTNMSMSPPPLPQPNFSNPQIAALAAAAAYHPLWPTYRVAAAAAAAAAQAQIAAAAASVASNAPTTGGSAFSVPITKASVEETTNFFSNSASNLSHTLSGASNAVDSNLLPYIPSPIPPFHAGVDSTTMQSNFPRQAEQVPGSHLFTSYHPYHLAAAAAFASSQMVELQRSFSASHTNDSANVPPATQDEDLPSSTTQEHSLIVSDEVPTKSKMNEKTEASLSSGDNERRSSSPVAKKRCSKNPYSIEEILREEEGSHRTKNTQMKILSTSTASISRPSALQSMQNSKEKGIKNDEDSMVSLDTIKMNSSKKNSLDKQNDNTCQPPNSIEENELNASKNVFVECDEEDSFIPYIPKNVKDGLTDNEEKSPDIAFSNDESNSLMIPNRSSMKKARTINANAIDDEDSQVTRKSRNLLFID